MLRRSFPIGQEGLKDLFEDMIIDMLLKKPET